MTLRRNSSIVATVLSTGCETMTTDSYQNDYISGFFKRGQTKVGWIDPEGVIHGTQLWEHANFFIENEWLIPEVTELLRPYYEEHKEPQIEAFRESGRQWHEYYETPLTLSDGVEQQARQIAYRMGWGRVGSYSGDKFELECFEDHRRNLSKHAREFAEVIGRTLTVEIVAPIENETAPKP